MKVGASARVSPIFPQLFPFKLKYFGLGYCLSRSNQASVRRFSNRSFRPRTHSPTGSRMNKSNKRQRNRSSKSLIEDEENLSDLVSESGKDSFPGPNSREQKSDEDHGRSRSRFCDRESFPTKKRQQRDTEEFGSSTQRRIRRNIVDSRGNDNSGEIDSQKKNFADDNSGGKSENSMVGRRREMEMNFDSRQTPAHDSFTKVEMNTDFRQARGGENFQKTEKRSRRPVHLVKSDDNDDEDGEDFTGSFGDMLKDGDNKDEGLDNDESDGYLMKKNSSSLFASDKKVSEEHSNITKILPGKNESYLSDTRFEQCAISPLSLKGIKDAGYEKMTVVQEATLPVILKGKDLLAKAKTGTGKTVAFLLPSIEVVVNSVPMDSDQKLPPIIVLVICPTRELANQVFTEANTLLKYHPSIGVQVIIGGTVLALEQKRLQAKPCQILVATPGRLGDHTKNTAGFASRLMGVKILVLDEADRLLHMGFRKDVEKIISTVPTHRQTLLFSATVPEEVRQICHIALKRDHEFINTVEEGSEETNSKVRQSHIIAPLYKHFLLLYTILKEHITDDADYKVLVFCTTAMVTRMIANLLSMLNLNVREIHSRKTQCHRTKVSDEFRKSKGLILVTSDVSARGVDYPDVTLVIQVGLPADREQYIHRLGRTGRKGKEGKGILILAPWEEFFLLTIQDLPISKAPEPILDPEAKKVERCLSKVQIKYKEAAYQAWLGYYNSNKKIGKDKYKLVELANEFSHSMGLHNPPAINKLVIGKMGLKNIPGLRSK